MSLEDPIILWESNDVFVLKMGTNVSLASGESSRFLIYISPFFFSILAVYSKACNAVDHLENLDALVLPTFVFLQSNCVFRCYWPIYYLDWHASPLKIDLIFFFKDSFINRVENVNSNAKI